MFLKINCRGYIFVYNFVFVIIVTLMLSRLCRIRTTELKSDLLFSLLVLI